MSLSRFCRVLAHGMFIIACCSCIAITAVGEKEKPPGKPHRVFRGHMLPVLSVAFSKDEKSVFSTSLFGFVKQWSLAEGKQETTLGTGWTCNASCLSRDGRLLAIACNNTTEIRVWQTTGRKPEIATSTSGLFREGNRTMPRIAKRFAKSASMRVRSVSTWWSKVPMILFVARQSPSFGATVSTADDWWRYPVAE